MSMTQGQSNPEWTDPFSYNAATSLQRDIIIELAQHYPEGISGKEIRDGLEDIYGERVSKGTFYMSVDRLATRGLVDKGNLDGRSHTLTLTDECVEYLDDYLKWCSDRGIHKFCDEVDK